MAPDVGLGNKLVAYVVVDYCGGILGYWDGRLVGLLYIGR